MYMYNKKYFDYQTVQQEKSCKTEQLMYCSIDKIISQRKSN